MHINLFYLQSHILPCLLINKFQYIFMYYPFYIYMYWNCIIYVMSINYYYYFLSFNLHDHDDYILVYITFNNWIGVIVEIICMVTQQLREGTSCKYKYTTITAMSCWQVDRNLNKNTFQFTLHYINILIVHVVYIVKKVWFAG